MQNLDERKFIYENALMQIKGEVDRMLSSSPLVIRNYTKHLAASMGNLFAGHL